MSVVAILTAVLLGATPAAAGPPDEWAQPGAHATNDRYNGGETRLTAENAGKLKPRWTVPHTEVTCADPSTPLVGGGKLLTAGAYSISAYNARTGAISWRTAVTKKRYILLATVAGTKVVAQYRDCRTGKAFLTALDVHTGRTLYTRPIGTTLLYGLVADKGVLAGGLWEDDAARYAMRGYRIADGTLLWSRAGSMQFPPIAARGRVLADGGAVDIRTGKPLWTLPAGCADVLGASTDGKRLFQACDGDEGVRVIDATSGEVADTFPGTYSRYSFATDGQRIYLLGYGGFVALDARTGKRLWKVAFETEPPLTFAVAGGVVYGWRGNGHALAAVEAATGKPIELPASTASVRDGVMIAQGRLYGITGAAVTAYAP